MTKAQTTKIPGLMRKLESARKRYEKALAAEEKAEAERNAAADEVNTLYQAWKVETDAMVEALPPVLRGRAEHTFEVQNDERRHAGDGRAPGRDGRAAP